MKIKLLNNDGFCTNLADLLRCNAHRVRLTRKPQIRTNYIPIYPKLFCFITIAVFFSGCSVKEPKIVYKDVFIPTKCQVNIPSKPKNNGTFKSHKALMIYFLECERLLKFCIGDKDDR